MGHPKNDKRTIWAWCMYDWANSVYSLVIISAIFPVYFSAMAREANQGQDLITLRGQTWNAASVFSFSLSFAMLLVTVVNPILTALADRFGNKKLFMQLFCILGAFSCSALFLFTKDTILFGIVAFVLATVGFAGSQVFYNAMLPDIATEDRLDTISARGYTFGYIGSTILLILVLQPILFPQAFGGISAGLASRIGFLLTGLWWFGFGLIPFTVLKNTPGMGSNFGSSWLSSGFAELGLVLRQAKQNKQIWRYLLAYFFFNMGVQTIMYLATLFGDQELKLPSSALIATILLLQLIAIPGAIAFSQLSKARGNILALSASIIVWVGVCICAYFVSEAWQFYCVAAVVGILMGGTQSLARATFSKLLVHVGTNRPATFFSLYDMMEKVGIVAGTLLFGVVTQIAGMRVAIFPIMLFFALGLILLQRVPWQRS